MEVVTGAMGSLLPKLGELLMKEYNLHKSAKKDIESLCREMKSMHAALLKVAEVPRDQLDGQLKLWADEVRELSYNMEDIIDKFLIRVDGYETSAAADTRNKLRRLMEKMGNLLRKAKARRQIANAIKDINKEVQEVASRRDRYEVNHIVSNHTVDNIVATPRPRSVTPIDPRVRALYIQVTKLVGIYGKRDHELIKLLFEGGDQVSEKKLKIVSIVGVGGLGKTTLAKAVYENIKNDFDCQAFVPVGRNPDTKKIFRDILLGLDEKKYTEMVNFWMLDENQLIKQLQNLLENKRYLVIIDDIWDSNSWKYIEPAFSNTNNLGSRLIITTRIVSVSEACCSADSIYQMKPLSDDDAAGLFYGRIFSGENRCPIELEEVSRNILKKCAGVPLAIITIASLLASNQRIKSKDQWNVLLDSFGRGLNIEDDSMKEMKMILSLSYYDLPSYMRTCLLYLSIYPEDWVIERDQLIWKWIAESFIQCENEEADLFELGESCFNELINRSMIQPIYGYRGNVYGCHVHDMILDLICSMSNEENFVTIVHGLEDNISSQRKFRRLSLQNKMKDQQTAPLNSMTMSQVKSITIFQPALSIMPALSSFDVLRVLDLYGLNTSSGCYLNIREVGNLLNLRYLNLKNIGISELPPEIGNLQFLQVLDVSENYELGELPSTLFKLKRLKFLSCDNMNWNLCVNLTCMEVLKTVSANNLKVVKDLGNLTRLRELTIQFSGILGGRDLEVEKAFVESLCNLRHIRSIILKSLNGFESMDLLGKKWTPSQRLRLFHAFHLDAFSVMPAWLQRDPSHLSNLSDLRIRIKVLQQEDVQILGRLPALRQLYIDCTHQAERLLLVSGADGFHCVISLELHLKSSTQIVFGQGALPSAEHVELYSGVLVAEQDSNTDHFDIFGLGNLLSLQLCHASILRYRVTVGAAKKVMAAVRNTLSAHPNHPNFTIYTIPTIKEGAHDDDLCERLEHEESEDEI